MSDSQLINSIIAHEGCEKFAYKDSLGYLTVGVGRCIDSKKGKGITKEEAMFLLNNDIGECSTVLSPYAWYGKLDAVRQGVFIELCFNLGLSGLLGFKNTLKAVGLGDFESAVNDLLDSRWATQIGKERIDNICYRLRNGKYPS